MNTHKFHTPRFSSFRILYHLCTIGRITSVIRFRNPPQKFTSEIHLSNSTQESSSEIRLGVPPQKSARTDGAPAMKTRISKYLQVILLLVVSMKYPSIFLTSSGKISSTKNRDREASRYSMISLISLR